VPEAPEIALLRKFRTELQSATLQIEVLTATRNSLMSVVAGLEETLRLKGVDFATRQTSAEQQSLLTTPVISSVIALLKSAHSSMGAKEIHRSLNYRGIVLNYSTLYKALNREAAKRNSVIRRRHGKYELSESTNNDTGTDR
jgi:hypothetical protein